MQRLPRQAGDDRRLRNDQSNGDLCRVYGVRPRKRRWQHLACCRAGGFSGTSGVDHHARLGEQPRPGGEGAARVNALAEEEIALPYHGSLARERDSALEERLKAGRARAVTTSSLELGIDIGSVDLVVQLQSPKRVAAALQRIGRAGHSLAFPARNTGPTFRDDAGKLRQSLPRCALGCGATHVVQNALV